MGISFHKDMRIAGYRLDRHTGNRSLRTASTAGGQANRRLWSPKWVRR